MRPDGESAISIRVDPANPGHFLACCGLLEIADRLCAGAESSFDEQYFRLWTEVSLADLLRALLLEVPEELTSLPSGLEVEPLVAPLRLELGDSRQTIVLDAWMTVRLEKGQVVAAANPPWNFWSGQQTSLRIWRALRKALIGQRIDFARSEEIFEHRLPLSGRFGFDPGAAWNALDVGFSPNEHRIGVASSPAVELLACVGIQRFRPALGSERGSFEYWTWGARLGVIAASAAAVGAIRIPPMARFRGTVVSRGSYSALGQSTLMERNER